MKPEVEAALVRVGDWTGWSFPSRRLSRLERFATWLAEEAIPAGGLGPAERKRIWPRHVLDSLLFAGAWTEPAPPPHLIDLGSGVGLPGIPLALLWPKSHVTLVDRSGRRADLAARAVRILDLDNVEVVTDDISRQASRWGEMVVARAVGPLPRVADWAGTWAVPGGRVVIGGSWSAPPTPGPGEHLVEVPPEVLDRPVWLRIMAAP
ncbi:MAG TPA: RsmG family class I SAM-dependent methyltransferase [Acidimicrobiia bacterium]|nr:RsmG family class I SAM-dependent methyltransferase [Acidimicrobiia bacterium]